MSGMGVGLSLKIYMAYLIWSSALSTKPGFAWTMPSICSSEREKPARSPSLESTFWLSRRQLALFYFNWLVET